MADLFKRRNQEQYTDSLAAYMPGGLLFKNKTVADTNFRKLLKGLAGELFNANGFLREYSSEILPDETSKFLAEWEQALGIPDGCFSADGSIEERRRDILIKLAALGVQTENDFIKLAALFGVTVQIVPGHIAYLDPGSYPFVSFGSEKESRFTIIFLFSVQVANRFTFTFPYTFGDNSISIIECLFNKLKPANCQIIFEQA